MPTEGQSVVSSCPNAQIGDRQAMPGHSSSSTGAMWSVCSWKTKWLLTVVFKIWFVLKRVICVLSLALVQHQMHLFFLEYHISELGDLRDKFTWTREHSMGKWFLWDTTMENKDLQTRSSFRGGDMLIPEDNFISNSRNEQLSNPVD